MEDISIIQKTYEAYKAIVEINNGIEKRYRLTLGISFENSFLDFLECVIMAKNAPKPLKASYLIQSTSKIEASTIKLRLILDLKLANETKIFQLQAKLEEIGRMLGGWLKAIQST